MVYLVGGRRGRVLAGKKRARLRGAGGGKSQMGPAGMAPPYPSAASPVLTKLRGAIQLLVVESSRTVLIAKTRAGVVTRQPVNRPSVFPYSRSVSVRGKAAGEARPAEPAAALHEEK